MIRILPDHVKERFTHVVGGAIQHHGIGVVLVDQFVNGCGVSLRANLVSEVAQRES